MLKQDTIEIVTVCRPVKRPVLKMENAPPCLNYISQQGASAQLHKHICYAPSLLKLVEHEN